MTESESKPEAGEPDGELASAKTPKLIIYLATHDVHKVTVKRKAIKDADGKRRRIRVVKINPPTAATLDEIPTKTLVLSPKKPGIKCTEKEILQAIIWVEANKERLSTGIPIIGEAPVDFVRVLDGLQKIEARLAKGHPKASKT